MGNRLSEDKNARVLLLEAGLSTKSVIQIPSGFYDVLFNSALHWRYEGEPEPQLNGRWMWQQRGKVLGGSSSINAIAYVRAHALDYENWAAMGAEGWCYAEVLPYFKKCETYEGGGDTYRGDAGPLGVQRGSNHSPLFKAFIQAGVQAGLLYGVIDLDGISAISLSAGGSIESDHLQYGAITASSPPSTAPHPPP
jgi:choline dehydrogenase